jgi:hypothetical protein
MRAFHLLALPVLLDAGLLHDLLHDGFLALAVAQGFTVADAAG